jgi:hypothetical protein
MATPTMITVTGVLQTPPGTPDATATVTFEQQVWLRHSDGTVIEPTKYEGIANGTGNLVAADGTSPFRVPPTTDPAWSPQDWTYRVTIDGVEEPKWAKPFRAGVPHDSPGATLTLGMLLPVPASGGSLYAPINHTHLTLETWKDTPGAPLTGAWLVGQVVLAPDGLWRCMTSGSPGIWRAASGPEVSRVVSDGEVAVDRLRPTGQVALADRLMVMTYFTAQVTETIQTFTTSTGGTGLATGSTHAWVAIYKYDGVTHTPDAVSVDDPSRWAAPNANYATQLFDAAHPGVGGFEGWHKVAGQRYASCMLWRGAGNAPQLPGSVVWPTEPYQEPRMNGLLPAQDFPPTVSFPAGFVQPDTRLMQAHFQR